MITGGTDNHLLLLDMSPLNLSGNLVEKVLEFVSINTNRNNLPPPTRQRNSIPSADKDGVGVGIIGGGGGGGGLSQVSGVRLGTCAVTTRGMKEMHMAQVAGFFHRLEIERE
jgi:glycine hydroxymethyltransferase